MNCIAKGLDLALVLIELAKGLTAGFCQRADPFVARRHHRARTVGVGDGEEDVSRHLCEKRRHGTARVGIFRMVCECVLNKCVVGRVRKIPAAGQFVQFQQEVIADVADLDRASGRTWRHQRLQSARHQVCGLLGDVIPTVRQLVFDRLTQDSKSKIGFMFRAGPQHVVQDLNEVGGVHPQDRTSDVSPENIPVGIAASSIVKIVDKDSSELGGEAGIARPECAKQLAQAEVHHSLTRNQFARIAHGFSCLAQGPRHQVQAGIYNALHASGGTLRFRLKRVVDAATAIPDRAHQACPCPPPGTRCNLFDAPSGS
ncbi:MAG: hypothetical protein Q8R63_00150 [Ramlibacter sp.]|nr:hypothetical protein [Ramlibacter sp.]